MTSELALTSSGRSALGRSLFYIIKWMIEVMGVGWTMVSLSAVTLGVMAWYIRHDLRDYWDDFLDWWDQ